MPIAKLTGTVDTIQGRSVVIDVAGVGYLIECTGARLAELEHGMKVSILTHTEIREDSIRLFGFADTVERQVFGLLTKVKGLGAKTAMSVLSAMDKLELLRAIGAGDVARLQQVRGIGRKSAERIVVELREKVADHVLEERSEGIAESPVPFDEAREALEHLGFSRNESERALSEVKKRLSTGRELDTSEILRQALQYV